MEIVRDDTNGKCYGCQRQIGKREGVTVPMSEMVGVTIINVTINYEDNDAESITLDTEDGTSFVMIHDQDCCETVRIKDITGDLHDLLNEPLLMAEEVSNQNETDYGRETWTFYKFGNRAGYVTISWHGESNGYYSESVDVIKLPPTGLESRS